MSKELKDLTDYDTIKKTAEKFFSKFNPDDKIFELINRILIQADDSVITPSDNYPNSNEIISWVEFKNKYNLKDEFGISKSVEYYNFDKKFIKISFYDYFSEFIELYNLIFGEEIKNFADSKYTKDAYKYGQWQNVGKIEIKIYQNNTADLRGDLTKIKEYYYKYLIKKMYNSLIIKYNGKIQIIKANTED